MKKGLSPLIATVLLIAFTIAVAGIVSNFLIDFSSSESEKATEKASKDLECSFSGLYIKDASYNNTTNTLTFNIQNNGDIDLTSFVWDLTYTNSTLMELNMTPLANTTVSPGSETIFTNTEISDCSVVSSSSFRSKVCPIDARDEVKKAFISGC